MSNLLVPKLVPKFGRYTFAFAHRPDELSPGGVGVIYKDSLPVIVRTDLAFDKSFIVLDQKFHGKKVFYTIFYRSPSNKHMPQNLRNSLLISKLFTRKLML